MNDNKCIENKNPLRTFTQGRFDLFVAESHLPLSIFAFILCCCLETFGLFDNNIGTSEISFPHGSVFYVLPLLTIAATLFRYINSKFAYKIIINVENNNISYTKYFQKDESNYNLKDIDLIHINWFTSVHFSDGNKFYYRGDMPFLSFLVKSDLKLTWGFWSKIFSKDAYTNYISLHRDQSVSSSNN